MRNGKRLSNGSKDRLAFIQEFIRHPLEVGSVIPSSRFLEQRIVKKAKIASSNVIVELGPGTGGVTRAILNAMPSQAKLLSIEINPHFHAMIRRIKDNRLIVHLGSACDLDTILDSYDLGAPQAIVSGIPFSTMSHLAGDRVLDAVTNTLNHDGHFVAYQVSRRVATLCEPFLGQGEKEWELFNIPPMRVYRWDKNGR